MAALNPAENPLEHFVPAQTHPMDAIGGVSVRAERLMREGLAIYRENAGLGRADVADRLEWSLSKIARIEEGKVGIAVTDAMAMLAIYGVQDEEAGAVIEMVRRIRHAVKSPYSQLLTPNYYQYLGCEAEASSLHIFQPDLVPDILQAQDYARMVWRVLRPDLDSGSTVKMEELRTDRAAYLLGTHGPKVNVIIDESVLHNPVEPEMTAVSEKYVVLAAALRRLKYWNTADPDHPVTEVSGQLNPAVSIQVIPWKRDIYSHPLFPYAIADFPDPNDASVLYVYSPRNDLFTQDPKVVEEYRSAFLRLQQDIPGPENTGKMVDYCIQYNESSRLMASAS